MTDHGSSIRAFAYFPTLFCAVVSSEYVSVFGVYVCVRVWGVCVWGGLH